MTGEDRAIFQRVIDDAYEQFLRAVAEGRSLPLERVKDFADGRIFTGERARGLGLVDEIGSLEDAIREAGRLAGIEGKPEVLEERPLGGWLGWLLEGSSAMKALGLPLSEVGARLQYRWMY
jgi:protease-4